MKEIRLTQGKMALVDDDIYEKLSQHKWYALRYRKAFYAGRGYSTPGKGQRVMFLHHAIMGCPPKGFMSDHSDGNTLNCQRKNLRFVTSRQNNQNRKNVDKSSRYPGVCWHKRDQRWTARIWTKGRREWLGYFTDELQAFQAYQQAVESLGQTVIDIPYQEVSP